MTLELLMQDNYKNGLAKGLAEGEKKGEKKGKAEGLKEGKAEAQAQAKAKEEQTVRNMYADHVPVNKIVQYVSLSADEVMSIVSEKS